MARPLLKYGSYGPDVLTVQQCLGAAPLDSDFGSITEAAVEMFQGDQGLDIDGVVGNDTWAALEQEFDLPPWPPEMLVPLNDQQIAAICDLAGKSAIASYNWRDRGRSPAGYVAGMALAWSTVYRKFLAGDSSAHEMAKANTHDDAKDALAWLNSDFEKVGMNNDVAGPDTLRHLWALLMGAGMRESSGRHCEGRDQSASNTSADTAESGLLQQSANSLSCSNEAQKLFDYYGPGLEGDPPLCALETFEEGVSCSSADWSCYGSPSTKGYKFQKLCKKCPQFAVEVAGIAMRCLRQHFGPINRREVEIRPEADDLFRLIQRFLDEVPVA